MRQGAIASGIFHLLLIALLVFGLPQFAQPLPEVEPISVEIVDVFSDRANPPPPLRAKTPIPPAATTKPLPPAETLHEAAPPPSSPPTPPAPTPPTPAPEPKPVAPPVAQTKPSPPQVAQNVPPPDPVKSEVPEPAPAKPVPEKPKEPEKPPAPEKPKEPEKPTPAKPAPEKPQPQKPAKPAKPRDEKALDLNDLDTLLNDHSDTKPGAPPPANARESDKPNRETTNSNRPNEPLSNSEKGLIIAQLAQCWRVDAGMAGFDKMSVIWRVQLDQSGALIGQPVLVLRAPGTSNAFADAAYRAFYKCSPFKNLPIAKYDAWRDLTVTFTPQGFTFGG